ncbi:Sec-independent protein translocase protein TatB [Thiomicrorhabdus sp. ZW0627]|uniref:Sec-independent protein translocase protein TatB n=1 Tax=Thiomicrorhabdus sp. ZW0627 TaxID=3039774 RepID=UPI002436B477|nr:Sec-independent protein translocase protein TatB [Thiomicrorhabdus sp. ZW0627]MDG6774533.1 Sec-independent protein translocase protein TatB [Thiomicrorhabdus sp. ZW0627]
MFDIGFLEILVVLVIALLVIGPERMPEVARKLGGFMGKTKRFINSVKEEGHWQETVRELKETIDLQEEKKQLQEIEKDLNNSFVQPTEDIDLENVTRPTFGGQQQPLDAPSQSQYSKAPAQPTLPKEQTTTEQPQESPASSTTESAPAPEPVASAGQEPATPAADTANRRNTESKS